MGESGIAFYGVLSDRVLRGFGGIEIHVTSWWEPLIIIFIISFNNPSCPSHVHDHCLLIDFHASLSGSH